MVSALERLKKHPAEVLEIIQSLKLSTEAVLEDALEQGGTLGEGDLPEDLNVEDDLLDSISSDNEQMDGNEKKPEVAEVPKANS